MSSVKPPDCMAAGKEKENIKIRTCTNSKNSGTYILSAKQSVKPPVVPTLNLFNVQNKTLEGNNVLLYEIVMKISSRLNCIVYLNY